MGFIWNRFFLFRILPSNERQAKLSSVIYANLEARGAFGANYSVTAVFLQRFLSAAWPEHPTLAAAEQTNRFQLKTQKWS